MITQIYGCAGIEDVMLCSKLGVDNVGISFGDVKHLGPHQRTAAECRDFFALFPDNITKVGLTIASDVDEIIHDLSICMPDIYHLSGDIENIPPEEVERIRKAYPELKIMQAIPVLGGVPLEQQKVLKLIKDYEEVTDFFLIDTKDLSSEIGIGATGAIHDRYIDKAIVESTKVPCIIAGGLDASNVAEAIHIAHPYGVDSCTLTSWDRSTGKRGKDPVKLEAFVRAAQNA